MTKVEIYENEKPYSKGTGIFFQYEGGAIIEVIQIYNQFYAIDSYGDRFQYYSMQTMRKKLMEFGAKVFRKK